MLQMGTDPVLTAVMFHRAGEVDWSGAPVWDENMLYDF